MSTFDATLRMALEAGISTNLNNQILGRIREIEAEAAAIRAENKKPGAKRREPIDELRPKIEQLKAAAAVATVQTVQALNAEIAEIQAKWSEDRDKHPEAELARIRRAENEIGGMSDEEVVKLVEGYTDPTAPDFDLPTQNLIRSRLRESGNEADLKSFDHIVKARRSDQPWLQNDGGRELADYRDLLSKIEPGQILYRDHEGQAQMPIPIDDLVDISGELDQSI